MAGIFSGILGDEASAQGESLDKNSQNMELLQANISSISLAEGKKPAVAHTEGTSNYISSNALVPTAGPLGAEDDFGIGGSDGQITIYVVRKGDTVAQVAEMFDITSDTILSANDMQRGAKLKEGDILLILPFSGVEHTVTSGETLQGIAKKYGVNLDEILIHNDVEADEKLAIGEKLMIPGGTLSGSAPAKKPGTSTAKVPAYNQAGLKNASGYYVNPLPGGKKSRGTNATHKGVDFGAPTGTPIRAAADGTVTFARLGYNGGFGNMVIISHKNGTETLYAHMSKLGTTPGAKVDAGDVIGYVGSTGRSTGPHLHFEVHGAKNPGNDWSWKK